MFNLRLFIVRAAHLERVTSLPLCTLPGVRSCKSAPVARRLARFCSTTNGATSPTEVGLTRRKVESLLKKRFGLKPEFPSPNLMRMKLPGFSPTAFGTQGDRQIICYLMKLVDTTMSYWPMPTKDPDEPCMIFMMNYEMNINRSFYDETKKWPILLDNHMNYVKRTSFCCQVDIRRPDDLESMVSARFVEINIDPKTRRPTAFPQWWKDENGFPEDGPMPETADAAKPDHGVVVNQRKIHFTDTDENDHTNFTVYVRMCLDELYENVLSNKYPNSSPEVLRGWIQNLRISYKADSGCGDILTIESWEDGGSPNTFHFEVKKGQDVATSVSLTMYNSVM